MSSKRSTDRGDGQKSMTFENTQDKHIIHIQFPHQTHTISIV